MTSEIFLWTFVVANIVVWFILLPLKWVRKVAKRNHRSVSGFCWLFVVAPIIAWSILLTIDKRDSTPTP